MMKTKQWLKGIAGLFGLLLYFALNAPAAELTAGPVRILLLHSYHAGFSWTDGVDAAIRKELAGQEGLEFYSEYLDSKRHPLETITPSVVEFLRQKYGQHQPDLLITSDNNALTLLRKHGNKLFPGIPVVFCGINNYSPKLLKGFENRITGVIEAIDPAGTVKLAKTLQPNLQRLIIISGDTPTSRTIKKEIGQVLTGMDFDAEVQWWDALTTEELSEHLKKLGTDDAVLLITFNRDGAGVYYTNEEAGRMISSLTAAPVYSMWDFYLGHGIVGGRMVSSRDQGLTAGKLARTIIKNGDIPPVIAESSNAALFDYNALRQHGLDPALLPMYAEVHGRPEMSQWPLRIAISLGALLTVVIIVMLARLVRMPLSSGLRRSVRLTYILRRNVYEGVAALVISLVIAMLIFSWFDYRTTLITERNRIVNEKKREIVNMVDQAMDQIKYGRKVHAAEGHTDEETQEYIKKRIAAITFAGEEGYIFVKSYDGFELVNRIQPNLIGKNILELTDINGVKVVRELIAAAKQPGGGFVSYVWSKPGLGRKVDKLSYARGIQDWGWVVGTGVYLDDVAMAMAGTKVRLKQSLMYEVVTVLGLGAMVLFGMMYGLRRLTRSIVTELDEITVDLKTNDVQKLLLREKKCSITEFGWISGKSGEALNSVTQLRTNLRAFFDSVDDFFFVIDMQGKILEFNRTVTERLGYSEVELAGQPLRFVYPPLHHKEVEQIAADMFAGKTDICTIPLQSKSGGIIEVETKLFMGEWNGCSALFDVSTDVTERKKLEAQLVHAQKMEAIGTLAGGVAHDLNNIFGGLVGYPELLLLQIPEDSPLRNTIIAIKKSGERAAAVVQDLLTLARRGVAATEVVNLNDVVAEYLKSPEFEKLQSYHPEVQVKSHLEKGILDILGSAIHLSKTVMNLVTNAAEAISEEGKILVSTENRYIDRPIKGYDNVKEGDYVVLTISDTGSGISPDDIGKIFEPFYTRKKMGRSGTGLGMAVVWGTVKDHGAYIDTRSTEGEGTTFTLYFPATREKLREDESSLTIESYSGNGETILIVDDVEAQRQIASGMLKALDYSVASVSSGEEAVEYLKSHKVDLLVLDMIMDPGMDGFDTYRAILEIHPGQRAIIASDFSETNRVKALQNLGAGGYIKKPFLLKKIGIAVKEELKK